MEVIVSFKNQYLLKKDIQKGRIIIIKVTDMSHVRIKSEFFRNILDTKKINPFKYPLYLAPLVNCTYQLGSKNYMVKKKPKLKGWTSRVVDVNTSFLVSSSAFESIVATVEIKFFSPKYSYYFSISIAHFTSKFYGKNIKKLRGRIPKGHMHKNLIVT